MTTRRREGTQYKKKSYKNSDIQIKNDEESISRHNEKQNTTIMERTRTIAMLL